MAMTLGFVSLKIFTNLLEPDKYAFIALMMSLGAWIWTGVYQPINQGVLRFYSEAERCGWRDWLVSEVLSTEVKFLKILSTVLIITIVILYVLDDNFNLMLLISFSTFLGVSYGVTHGFISLFLSVRKRKHVAFIQSMDGLLRLSFAVVFFYVFSKSELALASGVVMGGLCLVALLILLFRKALHSHSQIRSDGQLQSRPKEISLYKSYTRQMLGVMTLNASVLNLDKWLLFLIFGTVVTGKYAALFVPAVAMAALIYFFFEMVSFPIIFQAKSQELRSRVLSMTTFAYVLIYVAVIVFLIFWGEQLLALLTTAQIARESDAFILLVLACGLINLGRLMMAVGLHINQPSKYNKAYVLMLLFFVTWCSVSSSAGDLDAISMGYLMSAALFSLTVAAINKSLLGEDKSDAEI
jgi:hypothetical protein